MIENESYKIDIDFLIESRRNAYIECTENYLNSNNVVGIFGDSIPEELFYACGVIPVPIEGVDSNIFKFAKEGEHSQSCDVIKSTLIYLTTQKCPILFSCKMYVMQDICKNFIEKLKVNTEKKVAIYKTKEYLITTLCAVYGTYYDEKLKMQAKADLDYINKVIKKIKFNSNLDTKTVFLLEFYSKYITDLKTRRKYFEELEEKITFIKEMQKKEIVSALCPRGNYESICKETNTPLNRISRTWNGADYGYTNCPFNFKREMNY